MGSHLLICVHPAPTVGGAGRGGGQPWAAERLCRRHKLQGDFFVHTVYTRVYRPAGWLNFKECGGLKTRPRGARLPVGKRERRLLQSVCVCVACGRRRGGGGDGGGGCVCEMEPPRESLLNLWLGMDVRQTAPVGEGGGRQCMFRLRACPHGDSVDALRGAADGVRRRSEMRPGDGHPDRPRSRGSVCSFIASGHFQCSRSFNSTEQNIVRSNTVFANMGSSFSRCVCPSGRGARPW